MSKTLTNEQILQQSLRKADCRISIPIPDITSNTTLLRGIIFSHDFAKAFFGTETMCSACERHHDTFSDCDCGIGNDMYAWEVSLRQMVISEDPLRYLERFLND